MGNGEQLPSPSCLSPTLPATSTGCLSPCPLWWRLQYYAVFDFSGTSSFVNYQWKQSEVASVESADLFSVSTPPGNVFPHPFNHRLAPQRMNHFCELDGCVQHVVWKQTLHKKADHHPLCHCGCNILRNRGQRMKLRNKGKRHEYWCLGDK